MKLEILDIFKDESYVPTEPVTLAQAKQACLVDYTDDDVLIASIITQARKAIEDFCHISIVPKTIFLTVKNTYPIEQDWNMFNVKWDASFYGWPTSYEYWELPYGPTALSTSTTNIQVTRIDNTTAPSTITILQPNVDYFLLGVAFQKIRFDMWGDLLLFQYFTPGYCPSALQEAILNEIAFRYENRGSGVNRYAKQSVAYSEGAQYLALPYQRVWL